MNIEKFQPKIIVSHANCADGVAAAMIAKCAWPSADLFMINYGPERDQLQTQKGMLFIDITPPDDRVDEFVEAGAVVLDHHKKQKWIVEKFGDRGIFADEKLEGGVSGAVLAWRHVLAPAMDRDPPPLTENQAIRVKSFAYLVGVRDTWQKDSDDWETSGVLRETLLFYPIEHWLDSRVPFPTREEYGVGRVIYEKDKALIKRLAKQILRFRTDDGGYIGIMPAHGKTTSNLAEYLRQNEGVNTLATFWYTCNGEKLTLHVSMRSTEIDVSAVAGKLGGGGHTNAAGFEVTESFEPPLPIIRQALGC
jgi:hypothetical protein